MGYLSNTNLVVDAILTRKGRALLAAGQNEFNITHYALADDEIDYSLWNADHPLGTSYYGAIIEAMPITEAVPDETQVMKYKLVTLPKNTIRIPVVSVPNSSIVLSEGQQDLIKPQTINYFEGNSTYGYSAILADSDVCTLEVVETSIATGNISSANMVPAGLGLGGQSITLVGKTFRIIAKSAVAVDKTTTLTIVGNETGGQTVINITVNKQNNSMGLSGTSNLVIP